MKSISLGQLELARVLILENAISLLEEAELLHEHGYFARSYTLAHIASEEIVKLPMVVRVGIDKQAGLVVNWPKFHKKLRNHLRKIDAGAMQDYLWSEVRLDRSDVEEYERDIKATSAKNKKKNDSIYCGFEDGVAKVSVRPVPSCAIAEFPLAVD